MHSGASRREPRSPCTLHPRCIICVPRRWGRAACFPRDSIDAHHPRVERSLLEHAYVARGGFTLTLMTGHRDQYVLAKSSSSSTSKFSATWVSSVTVVRAKDVSNIRSRIAKSVHLQNYLIQHRVRCNKKLNSIKRVWRSVQQLQGWSFSYFCYFESSRFSRLCMWFVSRNTNRYIHTCTFCWFRILKQERTRKTWNYRNIRFVKNRSFHELKGNPSFQFLAIDY